MAIFDEYVKEQLENPTIDESLVPKFVVRDGKKVKKYISNKPGFKVIYNKGKAEEVKETKDEEIHRSNSAKRTASRRKKGLRNRIRSFKARRRHNIDYNTLNPAERTANDEK